MRMILQNYLKIKGNTIEGLAQKVGRSRESIRRWRDDDTLTSLVIFDPKTDEVDHIEIGRTKIIKAAE